MPKRKQVGGDGMTGILVVILLLAVVGVVAVIGYSTKPKWFGLLDTAACTSPPCPSPPGDDDNDTSGHRTRGGPPSNLSPNQRQTLSRNPVECGTNRMPFCTDRCITDALYASPPKLTHAVTCKDTDGWPITLDIPHVKDRCATDNTGFVPVAYTNVSNKLWRLSESVITQKNLKNTDYVCRKKCRCGPSINDSDAVGADSGGFGWGGSSMVGPAAQQKAMSAGPVDDGSGASLTYKNLMELNYDGTPYRGSLWTQDKTTAAIGTRCKQDVSIPESNVGGKTGTRSVSCGTCNKPNKAELGVLGTAPTAVEPSKANICPDYNTLINEQWKTAGRKCRIAAGRSCPNLLHGFGSDSPLVKKGGVCNDYYAKANIGSTNYTCAKSPTLCQNFGMSDAVDCKSIPGGCANAEGAGALDTQTNTDSTFLCGDQKTRAGNYTWVPPSDKIRPLQNPAARPFWKGLEDPNADSLFAVRTAAHSLNDGLYVYSDPNNPSPSGTTLGPGVTDPVVDSRTAIDWKQIFDKDKDPPGTQNCAAWADKSYPGGSQCLKNRLYMNPNCPASCKKFHLDPNNKK